MKDGDPCPNCDAEGTLYVWSRWCNDVRVSVWLQCDFCRFIPKAKEME